MKEAYRIGILAVQGAFAEHAIMFESLGAKTFLIRQKKDLEQPLDGIIFPGGESTVQGKLIRELDMLQLLQEKIIAGVPVFGTCAGMILLAKQLKNDDLVHLGLMNITVCRNAYGRQLGSFTTREAFGKLGKITMPFIRAPYIEEVGEEVEVLATVNNRIVAARQKNMLAISFHPEVTNETKVHQYFIKMIEEA